MADTANLLFLLKEWFPSRRLTEEETIEQDRLKHAIYGIGERWACDLWLLDHRIFKRLNWTPLRLHIQKTSAQHRPRFGESRLEWLERTIGWKPVARGADNPLLQTRFLGYLSTTTKDGQRVQQWLALDAWEHQRGLRNTAVVNFRRKNQTTTVFPKRPQKIKGYNGPIAPAGRRVTYAPTKIDLGDD